MNKFLDIKEEKDFAKANEILKGFRFEDEKMEKEQLLQCTHFLIKTLIYKYVKKHNEDFELEAILFLLGLYPKLKKSNSDNPFGYVKISLDRFCRAYFYKNIKYGNCLASRNHIERVMKEERVLYFENGTTNSKRTESLKKTVEYHDGNDDCSYVEDKSDCVDLWLDIEKYATKDEINLIKLIYVEGYTYREIGQVMGVSRQRVEQKVRKIIEKLRRKMVNYNG